MNTRRHVGALCPPVTWNTNLLPCRGVSGAGYVQRVPSVTSCYDTETYTEQRDYSYVYEPTNL